MKRRNLVLGFVISLFLITLVSAEVNSFQNKYLNPSNTTNTIREYLTVNYDKMSVILGKDGDFIRNGDPLEIDLTYQMYPQSWNLANPLNRVQYCNLTIFSLPSVSQTSEIIFNDIVYANETDTGKKDYFIKLFDGDTVFYQMDCKFLSTTSSFPIYPASMQLSMPTWECKACQYYEWSQRDVALSRFAQRDSATKSTWDYISQLVLINYSILIALFWIAMILMLYLIISMVLLAVYSIFLYVSRFMR